MTLPVRAKSLICTLTLSCLMAFVPTAKAETTYFFDNYGLTTGTSSFAGNFGCGPTTGACEVLQTDYFAGGAASSFLDTSIPSPIFIGDSAGNVSAELVTVVTNKAATPEGWLVGFTYTLTAGLDLSSPFTCTSVSGCQFTQDGTVQILGTNTFLPTFNAGGSPLDIPSDIIEFQFAPEPGSVMLIGLGLACLAALKLRA